MMRAAILFCTIGSVLLSAVPGWSADTVCFRSAKTYRIHPLRGGADLRDGWDVQGGAFNACVHRAEAADKALRARYPDTVYQLSLAATIGCHSPC
jgi:hypothetical protein